MTILFTSPTHTHHIDADAIAPLVRDICNQVNGFTLEFFDIIHINLIGYETVVLYDVLCQCEITTFTGASAWKLYELLTEPFPQINHHFRQPTPAKPPTVLSPEG
jgi:hypothetical protein